MCLIPLAPAVKTPGLLPIGAKGIRHDPFQGTYVPPFRSPSNFFQLPWLCSSGSWRAACKCHRSHFGSRYKLGCCGHAGLFDHGFEPGWEQSLFPEHAISGGPSYLASILLNLDAVMCCAAVCINTSIWKRRDVGPFVCVLLGSSLPASLLGMPFARHRNHCHIHINVCCGGRCRMEVGCKTIFGFPSGIIR